MLSPRSFGSHRQKGAALEVERLDSHVAYKRPQTRFAERKSDKHGLKPPTLEGITIYGYALSTIKQLNYLLNKDKSITNYLIGLSQKLEQLSENKKDGKMDLKTPKKFFLILGEAMREELHRERYIPNIPASDDKPSPNVSLLA